MRIIVTHINQNGIVHAADSNLTTGGGAYGGIADKVFEIPRHKAGLTIAGAYSVGGMHMNLWLTEFINNDTSVTLGDFVETLRFAIDQEATRQQKSSGYFFHIAGYTDSGGIHHPEFYHVTNCTIGEDGNYSMTQTMRSSEDFWSRHSTVPLDEVFADRRGYIYCNGFPSGRQVYFELLTRLSQLRSQVWNNSSWSFRAPNSIAEEADVLKLDMEQVSLFFRQSTYSAPIIGGPIKILTIAS